MFVQADVSLNALLLERVSLGQRIRVGLVFIQELGESVINQTALMFQIAARYVFSFWMRSQPAFAMAQEFCDLVITHPIVFVVIQDGQKHIQMRK